MKNKTSRNSVNAEYVKKIHASLNTKHIDHVVISVQQGLVCLNQMLLI